MAASEFSALPKESSAMDKLFNLSLPLIKAEMSLTLVEEISKCCNICKSSMIIVKLVLLNSVSDTLRLVKFRSLESPTATVPFCAFQKVELDTSRTFKFSKVHEFMHCIKSLIVALTKLETFNSKRL